MGRTLWTAEQKEILKRLWAEGRLAREIGTIIGVSRNAVIGQAHRQGLARTEIPAEERERRREARRQRGIASAAKGLETRRLKAEAEYQRRLAKRRHYETQRARALIKTAKPARREGPVTIIHADNDQCRWPLWDSDGPLATRIVCGERGCSLLAGQPYCGKHSAEAYRSSYGATERLIMQSIQRRWR